MHPKQNDTVPTPAAWTNDLTEEQKVAYMKNKVLPTMTSVFQAEDGKRYASFGCATCHGPVFKETQEYLPKLVMKGGKITAFADNPHVAKFMAETVGPKMAATLGQTYDMSAAKGFGCAGCHAIDKK